MDAAAVPFISPRILERFRGLSTQRKLAFIGAVVFMLALIVWGISSRSPGYRVVAEKIVTAQDREDALRVLDQQGIDARIDGDKILVREEAASRATQSLLRVGLPRTRTSMAEAMRQIPFGTTSFHEQVVEAEARQNELSARIEEMDGVRRARVLIHMPKPSVFLREEEKPTAAATVYMHKGFSLDKDMVRSVASIVAAAGVPEDSVRVIDGTTGKVMNNQSSREGLNTTQLEYIEKLKRNREEDIIRTLSVIAGAGRVSATVNVDVDFSKTEQTSENFKPNPQPAEAVVRSQHTKEATAPTASVGGVPGALSNQPPGAASAPLVAPSGASGNNNASAAALLNAQRESVVNYEVDKTIRHVKGAEWGIKRVTASVVVNIAPELFDPKNKNAPFKDKEDLERQMTDLIKGAIGFDEKRGDTIQILNTPFAEEESLPLYKNPQNIALFKEFAINALWGGIVLYVFFGIIRPTMRYLFANQVVAAPERETPEQKAAAEQKATTDRARRAAQSAMSSGDREDGEGGAEDGDDNSLDDRTEVAIDPQAFALAADEELQRHSQEFDQELMLVQAMIRRDPRMAAEILKAWMTPDE